MSASEAAHAVVEVWTVAEEVLAEGFGSVLACSRAAAGVWVRSLVATMTVGPVSKQAESALAVRYTGVAALLLRLYERLLCCLFSVLAPAHVVSVEAASAWVKNSLVSSQGLRLGVVVDIPAAGGLAAEAVVAGAGEGAAAYAVAVGACAVGVAFAEASADTVGIADSRAGAWQAAVGSDMALAATANTPEASASASASGGIADSHVAGSHLAGAGAAAAAAAAEAHMGCIGRSHRPAAASCTVDPCSGFLEQSDHQKSILRRCMAGEGGV